MYSQLHQNCSFNHLALPEFVGKLFIEEYPSECDDSNAGRVPVCTEFRPDGRIVGGAAIEDDVRSHFNSDVLRYNVLSQQRGIRAVKTNEREMEEEEKGKRKAR